MLESYTAHSPDDSTLATFILNTHIAPGHVLFSNVRMHGIRFSSLTAWAVALGVDHRLGQGNRKSEMSLGCVGDGVKDFVFVDDGVDGVDGQPTAAGTGSDFGPEDGR